MRAECRAGSNRASRPHAQHRGSHCGKSLSITFSLRSLARIQILVAEADHPRRVAYGDGIVGNGFGHHRAGTDDAVAADIGQDDRSVADPGIAADCDPRKGPWLLPDRGYRAGRSRAGRRR